MSHVRNAIRLVLALCAGLTAVHADVSAAADTANGFEIVADTVLPGDTSRFDYASLDAAQHRLWIAHLGASEVLAFDTIARKVVARIPALSQVHGVLAVPALHRVYASATGTDEVVAIDDTTFTIVARMPGGRYPDGMAYAPDVQKLYVSDETGATETVLDLRTNRRVATIPLGGEVGNSQYDSASKHVFANVQTRAELVEIDPAADTIVRRIALPGAKGNHGLMIEAPRRRAFVACEDDDTLRVVNLESGAIEATFDVGHAPDVLSGDAATGSVYVAAESGSVSVFRSDAQGVTKTFQAMLGPNAHVVALDPLQRVAYFPLKNVDGRPRLRIVKLRD